MHTHYTDAGVARIAMIKPVVVIGDVVPCLRLVRCRRVHPKKKQSVIRKVGK